MPALTADALLAAFKADPKGAEAKYAGRQVLVSGKYTRAGDRDGELTTSQGAMLGFSVFKPKVWEKTKLGEEVTLLGRCDYDRISTPPVLRIKDASPTSAVKP